MIDKRDLEKWFNEGDKRRSVKKIENYVDEVIKENALKRITTFIIFTYEQNTDKTIKTDFHDLWFAPELSKKDRYQVQERVIEKYKVNGYSVERYFTESQSKGKSQGLRFVEIHRLLE